MEGMMLPTRQNSPDRFGLLFRRARNSAGTSLDETAAHLGVTKGYVSDIELGKRAPFESSKIRRAAALFRVDGADLLISAARDRGTLSLADLSPAAAGILLRLACGKWPSAVYSRIDQILNTEPRDTRKRSASPMDAA
jgi:transcriptional regulator with XRE-family HTH domain